MKCIATQEMEGFSWRKGGNWVWKPIKCPYCGEPITIENVSHLPSFNTRLYCGSKMCLMKYLESEGYYEIVDDSPPKASVSKDEVRK